MLSDDFNAIKSYFDNNHDLMRHLANGACWEYIINDDTLESPILFNFYLVKIEDRVHFKHNSPTQEPDIILYFTKEAILELIKKKPSADEYFKTYRHFMKRSPVQLDSKINKPRMKLLRLGYRKWQKDFNF